MRWHGVTRTKGVAVPNLVSQLLPKCSPQEELNQLLIWASTAATKHDQGSLINCADEWSSICNLSKSRFTERDQILGPHRGNLDKWGQWQDFYLRKGKTFDGCAAIFLFFLLPLGAKQPTSVRMEPISLCPLSFLAFGRGSVAPKGISKSPQSGTNCSCKNLWLEWAFLLGMQRCGHLIWLIWTHSHATLQKDKTHCINSWCGERKKERKIDYSNTMHRLGRSPSALLHWWWAPWSSVWGRWMSLLTGSQIWTN